MPQKYDKIKEVVKEDEFMKNICCKKMWNLFAVVVFTLILYACAETTGVYQTGDSSTETDSQRSETKISRTNQQAVPVNEISLYQVPLEEIAERIEYEYVYENRIYHIADYDYKLLSFLPAGGDITISVYTVEGNKILFLPEEKANTDAVVNGEQCRLHYSEEAGGFIFYVLVDWQLSENGVPVNALEDNYDSRIRECIVYAKDAIQKEVDYQDSPIYFLYKFGLEDLVKVGDVKVNFDPEETMEFQKISVENNVYLDAVTDFAAKILREKQKYGKFQICLETYGRVPGKYGAYTEAKVSAAVVGEGMEDYLFFTINDNGSVTAESVWPEYYPSLEDDPGYFVSARYLEEQPEDFIPGIVELQREVIELEVREEENPGEETGYIFNEGEYNQEIDFRAMSQEETAELINYAYSYEEWFGMNELGCQTGELRGLQGEAIAMYSWDNNGDSVFFVPKSRTNTHVTCGNKENCPMYVDRYGEMEFYTLERNGYAKEAGQLKTTFFMKESLSADYAEHMIYLGEAKLTLQELPSLDVEKTEEDAYISAFREYIGDVLRQNGRSGEYEITIGEYEALHENKVCLSAAVSGGEECWYFRDLVVNDGDGNYYFWPVGFGLNGSLEECEAGKHYMNALCIERTKKLARNRSAVEVKTENTVLSYDICSSPKCDYENTPLAEYVENDIAWNEEMSQKMGKSFPMEIDYHRFDFNDDGVEDYLLCESGELFNGRWGNGVQIFIQEEDGMKCVLSTLMWLHDSLTDHGNLMVMDEKTNGYYAIVLPHGGEDIPEDAVLRYNEKTGKYDLPADKSWGFMTADSDFVNFRDLERNHKILAYDVCSSPKYDYENTPLAAYIEESYVTETEETSKRTGNELTMEIDYHQFDFNGDGVEDYLLCVWGSLYCGSGGNNVEIWIQEEGGVKKVLDITTRLHNSLSDHGMLTVLDEKTGGYYAIVLPESNYILRYDEETGQYGFGDIVKNEKKAND